MKLRPFFCFYGGKWRSAPHYPAPEHAHVIEPFAGAAGYSTRYAERRVTLVEKDPIIAGLWRFLITATPAEIRALPLMALDQTIEDMHVSQEARWLIGFWLNKGVPGPRKRPSAWMRSGIRPHSFWGERVRELLASQVDSIKHWKVIEGSFAESPAEEATWFVDPPYDKQGYAYKENSSSIDFEALGEWVKSRRGLTIACEQEGAAWLPFAPFRSVKANESKNGAKRSAEVVYVQRT